MKARDPQKVDIGQRFREAREKQGWTREKLAELSELSVPFLANLELGHTGVRLDRFQRLCKLLHVSADYVLYGEVGEQTQEIVNLLRSEDDKTVKIAARTLRAMLEGMKEANSDESLSGEQPK